ncbi:MAG: FGGY family carbohydrate kinase [Patescibacteria group bacterium]|nr:FGGY family carbohydrate kinase [Patescibacteria group bacterium]
MRHILSLDIGTTSTRAIVFDSRLKKIGQVSLPLNIFAGEDGNVEQDPIEIWTKTLSCARRVLKATKVNAKSIACIGIANQRETVVGWNSKNGKPVARAIVWQDRRTAERCKEIESRRDLARRIRATTGLVVDPSFSATKIEWLNSRLLRRDYTPRSDKTDVNLVFGTIDSWILWNLTNGRLHATEPSNASRTMLFNLKTLTWDEDLLKLFGIKESQMPLLMPSEGQFDVTDKKLFGCEIPITGILGDQQASLFSHGPLGKNMTAVTYGTGIFALKTIGDLPHPAASGILTTVAWHRPEHPIEYAFETSALTGGAMLEWFKDQMSLVKDMKELDALADSVSTTGGVTIVPAFSGLAAPDWDPTARGLIIGLNRGTTKAHLCRAAIEAIACQAARMSTLLDEQTNSKSTFWKVSGGLAHSNPLMQSQADMSLVKVCRSNNLESTAAGAAMIAGLGAGVWKTWEQASKFSKCEKTFIPKRPARGGAFLAQYERAIERSKGWA